MTSDNIDIIVDTRGNQSKVKTYQNHKYVDISEFGLQNALDTSSTSQWKWFLEELEFDEIAASAAHSKLWK